MKFLIVGLGNIGDEYENTRHNIGFMVLDSLAEEFRAKFTDKRYGRVCEIKYRNSVLILLKPSTYMNLSGYAVSYWLKKEKIPVENLLVIVDDLALPLGSFRMRPKGSDGGHNGLAHINTVLATNQYARIRIGIGNGFQKGSKVNYVLGKWTPEEMMHLRDKITVIGEMIKSFGTSGLEATMTKFNKAGRAERPGQSNTDEAVTQNG